MYIYVRGAAYDYDRKHRELKKAADAYVSQLKRVAELPPRQVSQNLLRLKEQRQNIDDMLYNLQRDETSKASTVEALQDLLDSGLKNIPKVLEQYIRSAGYDISVPYKELTISDFQQPHDWMSMEDSHNGANGRFRMDIIPYGTSCDVEGLNGYGSQPKQVEAYINKYIKKVVDASEIPMVTCKFYLWVHISNQTPTVAYMIDKYDCDTWSDLDHMGFLWDASVPDMDVEIQGTLFVNVGSNQDYYHKVLGEHPELEKLDDKVIRAKPNLLKKYRSTSSAWDKTIDLRDYFPPEAFDEDGEFNEDLTTEEDWINFNMDDLQNGFGNPRELYTSVLNKAGVPPYIQFIEELVNDDGVYNDGNMEFLIPQNPAYDTPDIRFGFDMNINGHMADMVLSYAEVKA